MSVQLETSLGKLTVDLFTKECPRTAFNFLKLCKIKYYHGCLFFSVRPTSLIQAGDPTGTGSGGSSIYGIIKGEQFRFFKDEINPKLKHDRPGLLCMAPMGKGANGSQFYITLDEAKHFDGKHTVFGQVVDGIETLQKFQSLVCDKESRPLQDVRVRHTHVLLDPYPDPPGLQVPPSSPRLGRPPNEAVAERLDVDEDVGAMDAATEMQLAEEVKDQAARRRAVALEMLGDLPDADVAPPDNVLFVCKLNPITTDDDLGIIFSRFGQVKECHIAKDPKTQKSLQYAFVEFSDPQACTEAYFKMNNVLIDDRRIKVDFSQSVSRLWNQYHRREDMAALSESDMATIGATRTAVRQRGVVGGQMVELQLKATGWDGQRLQEAAAAVAGTAGSVALRGVGPASAGGEDNPSGIAASSSSAAIAQNIRQSQQRTDAQAAVRQAANLASAALEQSGLAAAKKAEPSAAGKAILAAAARLQQRLSGGGGLAPSAAGDRADEGTHRRSSAGERARAGDHNDDEGRSRRRHRRGGDSDDEDRSRRRHRRSGDSDDEDRSRRRHRRSGDSDDEDRSRRRRRRGGDSDDEDRSRRRRRRGGDSDDEDRSRRRHRHRRDAGGRRRHGSGSAGEDSERRRRRDRRD